MSMDFDQAVRSNLHCAADTYCQAIHGLRLFAKAHRGSQQRTGTLLLARLRCAADWPAGMDTTWRPPWAGTGKEHAGSPVRSCAGIGSGELLVANRGELLPKPAPPPKPPPPLPPGCWNRLGGVLEKPPPLAVPRLLVKLPVPAKKVRLRISTSNGRACKQHSMRAHVGLLK